MVSTSQAQQVYFGTLHSHTSYSDGSGKPNDAFKSAKAAGMDFIAVTEHNHLEAELGAEDRTDGILIAKTPELYNGTGSASLVSAAPNTF